MAWIFVFVFVVCSVGSGICDELITRSGVQPGVCVLTVCDLGTSMRGSWVTDTRNTNFTFIRTIRRLHLLQDLKFTHKKSDHLLNMQIDGRIILKTILKKKGFIQRPQNKRQSWHFVKTVIKRLFL
jgi:hypothetical protein